MRGLLFTLIILSFGAWVTATYASGLGVFHVELRGEHTAMVCEGEASLQCRPIPPLVGAFLKMVGIVTYVEP